MANLWDILSRADLEKRLTTWGKQAQGGDTRTFQEYDKNNATAQRQIGSSAFGAVLPNNPYRAEAEQAMVNNTVQAMTDPTMGIVSPKVAKSLTTKINIPDNPILAEAIANTPNASLTADGIMVRLQRNQMPEQALEPSVRGGVFYLPEGAAQAKHYSTGKNGYGGRDKIAGETLIQAPLLAKGGTGGKAPESAYDSLVGKGGYESMRKDALQSLGRYGATAQEKANSVEQFLSKYAPEMADQARYIVDNSKQGNQLAYALQEAAVASKVRGAGHDAVVGYSKGKSGNFVSEVYDVRESHYPDLDGTGEIWDSLFKKR